MTLLYHPGMHPKECKPAYSGDTCSLVFIAALFITAKMQNQLKCPSTDEWIKKMWHIYTMEYYLVIKKN
jgi:hypothetical protein